MKYRQPSLDQLPTAGELIRSTIIALISAFLILVTVVLPAEYAIDPTRIGSLLGLTRMGEIKIQLAEEAKEAESSKKEENSIADFKQSEPAINNTNEQANSSEENAGSKTDQVKVIIPSDEGAEIKVEMLKGASIDFTWKAEGGSLNFDSHGEESNSFKTASYDKGTNKNKQSGTLTAKFDGTHGWYWRNRSRNNVTLTLDVKGDYISVKEVK